jgi:hypothetical protein
LGDLFQVFSNIACLIDYRLHLRGAALFQTTSLTARMDVVLIHLRLYSIACWRCDKLGSLDFWRRY